MSKAVERLATAPVPFRAVIETARRLDELSTARIIGDIADAVHKAQTGGKPLHRLTPDAIVISPAGEPSLSLAPTDAPLAYAAPERAKGMTGDRRSDVFSLGVVLWESLAHARLFDGATDDAIKQQLLAGEIRSPSEQNANVPAELDAICKKALARDPADRYQSAKVMAAEISAVLDDAGYPEDHSLIAKFLSELAPSAKDTMPGIGPKVEVPTAAPKPTVVGKESSRPTGKGNRSKRSSKERTKTPTAGSGERAKSPTSQPLPGIGDRPKSPTSPGSLAERLAAAPAGRTKAPTNQPVAPAAPASEDPGKTAILGSGVIDEKTALASVKWHDNTPLPKPEAPTPAPPILPAAPVVAQTAGSRSRTASQPPPTEPTASPVLATAAGSQSTAAPTPLVRVGSAPIAKVAVTQQGAAPAPIQNGAVATPVDVAGSGATRAAGSGPDLPEAANAVTLPRAQTKGDVLQGWGWGTDSQTAINPIEDDDDETYAAERAKQRKRLFMAIGGVFGAIVLVVVIALAFGGGGKSTKEPVTKPASGAAPALEQPRSTPSITTADEPAPEPVPEVAKHEPPPEPVAKEPEPEPEPEPQPKPEPPEDPPKVAKQDPPKVAKQDPPKVAKQDPPKVAKQDPPKVAKKDPPKDPPKGTKKDPKPVDPYSATKVDAATAYRTGLQQFAKGDNKAALETFRTSLTTNQSHAPTWRGIGLVYEKLGKKAQAKIAFKKYLELSPNASDAQQIKERLGRL